MKVRKMKRNTASDNIHEAATRKRLVTPVTWARLLGAWGVVGLFSFYGSSWLAAPLTTGVASMSFAVLLLTILAASFGVVHEADYLAHKLGEPYGTLILTLSIVSIEVILIASVLLGPGEAPTIGRDSIFAVLMIILNLVMGLCLVAGAARHGEQEFNAQGATAYMSMIAVLTTVALVLPKFTSTAGEFSREQAIGIGALTALLYAAFLWKQIGSHKRLFVQPPPGSMVVRRMERVSKAPTNVGKKEGSALHHNADVWLHSLLLLAMVVPIVLLGHHLAVVLDYGIAVAGAPVAVSGVLIALIVFTPRVVDRSSRCSGQRDATSRQPLPGGLCLHGGAHSPGGSGHWLVEWQASHHGGLQHGRSTVCGDRGALHAHVQRAAHVCAAGLRASRAVCCFWCPAVLSLTVRD